MDLITRTAKRYYEETFLQGPKQIFSSLFPTVDASTTSSFLLDTLIQEPYGISYRDRDMQSELRPYVAGSGQLLDVPRSSEKTPISETLLDAVTVGLESTAGFGANEARIIGQIVRDHVTAHTMTKNKQALDVIETGVFTALGRGDKDIGLNIDFGRKTSLNMAYDFTQVDASFSEAVENQLEELRANGTPLSNVMMICGADWLGEYSNDVKAQEASQNNAVNMLNVSPMTPTLLKGTQGLYVVGQMRTRKMLAPVWICSYSPGVGYKSQKDSVASEFLASDKALMISADDTRWQVQRGLLVKGTGGKATRKVGEMVMDTYTTDDPITTYLRSATRHAFVPANINHTSCSTGTFA